MVARERRRPFGYLGIEGHDLATAIGPRGSVLVAWASANEAVSINDGATPAGVYAAVRPREGRFGAPRELARDSALVQNDGVAHLDAAYTSDGIGVLGWTEGHARRARAQPVGRVRGALVRGRRIGSARTLDSDPKGAQVADVAADARGRAIVLWRTRHTDARFFDATLLASSLVTERGFGARRLVSPAGDRALIDAATVAFDRNRATVLWTRFSGSGGRNSRLLAASRGLP